MWWRSNSIATSQGDRILCATIGCDLEAIVDFFEAVSARRSVHIYRATVVEHTELEMILTAANTAPSAGNLQAYEIVVVRCAATRSALAAAAHGQEFLAQAPVVLVFFADPARSAARYGTRGEKLFCIQDATIAACHAQLAATDLGLGTCWVGAFDDKRVTKTLAAPPQLRPVCLLAIGHAAEQPSYTSRRQLSDLVHEETYKAA
jgi:nitroreductase